MLSPASLRVCCLAVMAPALTKADRQADCLPVVLSESFCLAKTSDTFNITARLSDNRQKCVCYPDYSHNKRPFMHRACWRTQKSGSGILCKYRTVGNDSCKSLLLIKGVRTLAKYKTWQSTKATTAYAGKIKLKYTMNKNTSNIRNMGLAKANTSLGLQRKIKRFSKENQSSGPLNVMDDSLNFSDSADSPVPMAPLLTNTPNSDCDTSLVENVQLSCNHGRTSEDGIQNTEFKTAIENAESTSVQGNDSGPLLSAGADAIEAMDTSNSSVTLTGMLHLTNENNGTSKHPETSVSECNVPGTCAIGISIIEPQQSTVELQPESGNSVLEQPNLDISVGCEVNSPEPLISKQESNSIFTNFTDLKLSVLNSKCSGNLPMGSSLFSLLKSSMLLTNATKLSLNCGKQVNCPVIQDYRYGSNLSIPVRQEKNPCCSASSQELDSLKSVLAEKTSNIAAAVSSSARIHTKYLSAHIKKQIGSLVEHYQRNLQIPCQRPVRHASAKSVKHLQDTKVDTRPNEVMKHMSTSELVRFVQSQDKIATKPNLLSATTIPSAPENVPLNFDPEDCVDIKHTSGVLLSTFRNAARTADPYLTESSDEEFDSESDDEETASECETTTENENALWNYMMKRTKLGSRSTWLLARIHELEFKIKEFSDSWNELMKLEGNVCLEQPTVSLNSSFPESDETDLQTAVMKNFLLPLNGFLDRNDASHIAREALQSEIDVTKSSESESVTEVCCRTRPFNSAVFRKRKIVVIPGLHSISPNKLSRLSTVNCTCNSLSDLAPCILCTGQYHNVQSADPELIALRDRIAILDPYFHPILSTEKEIPFSLHLENVLKTDTKYHSVREPSPEPNIDNYVSIGLKPKYSDLRSHRKLSRYARSLSAKYRNKHHRTTKHLRKHKLVFGKWRRLHKHALRTRNRFRRQSVVSSGSSADSPVHSPMSLYDDGSERRRRDDSQFDIDDVIIPCSSRSGRMVEIQYKEIVTPSWRNTENEVMEHDLMDDIDDVEENITDSYLVKRHDILEIEEKERMKRSALGLNRRRRNRCDSRADSSGANTPDPTSLYNNQDNVFQIPNFNVSAPNFSASAGLPNFSASAGLPNFSASVGLPNFGTTAVMPKFSASTVIPNFSSSAGISNFSASAGPTSPSSPPATPSSAVISDDSQPSIGNGSLSRSEKKKVTPKPTTVEESTSARSGPDFDEVPPFEPLQFPLPDDVYEQLLAESDHNKEVFDMPSNTSSFPASPITSSSSTSTVEDEDDDEDDDASDPEWTVVKPIKSCSEQALVLKFAKR